MKKLLSDKTNKKKKLQKEKLKKTLQGRSRKNSFSFLLFLFQDWLSVRKINIGKMFVNRTDGYTKQKSLKFHWVLFFYLQKFFFPDVKGMKNLLFVINQNWINIEVPLFFVTLKNIIGFCIWHLLFWCLIFYDIFMIYLCPIEFMIWDRWNSSLFGESFEKFETAKVAFGWRNLKLMPISMYWSVGI